MRIKQVLIVAFVGVALLGGAVLVLAVSQASQGSNRDLEAEYRALVDSVAPPDTGERATHTDFLALAEEIENEEKRRRQAVESSNPRANVGYLHFTTTWLTEEELVESGTTDEIIAEAQDLLAWYDDSDIPDRLAGLIAKGPPSVPAPEWDTGNPDALSNDAGLRGALRTLAVAESSCARLLAERGDLVGFADALERMLSLEEMFGASPSSLSDITRFSIQGTYTSAVIDWIERGRFDPDIARRLEAILRAAEDRHLDTTLHHLAGERRIALQTVVHLRTQANALMHVTIPTPEAVDRIFDEVEAFLSSPTQVADLPEGARWDASDMTRVLIMHARASLVELTRLRGTRLALAIEQYRSSTGTLPASLEALVEAGTLDELPANVVDADPTFGYALDERSPTGYTLSLQHPDWDWPVWLLPNSGLDDD